MWVRHDVSLHPKARRWTRSENPFPFIAAIDTRVQWLWLCRWLRTGQLRRRHWSLNLFLSFLFTESSKQFIWTVFCVWQGLKLFQQNLIEFSNALLDESAQINLPATEIVSNKFIHRNPFLNFHFELFPFICCPATRGTIFCDSFAYRDHLYRSSWTTWSRAAPTGWSCSPWTRKVAPNRW